MTRVAAVDCGTNSIRLLVTDLDPTAGTQADLDRRLETVRLGQDVDRTGSLAPAALERTMTALREYAGIIDRLGVERVRMVATSATRDAANRDVFVAGVRDVLGVDPEVVSGADEAALSYGGAVRGLPASSPAPYLVTDIGGGSTEVAFGTDDVKAARSVDVGCVRLTERRFAADPPTPAQVRAAVQDIDAALDDAATDVDLASAATLVGLAGSVTTVAAIHLDLPGYDPTAIHHSRVPATDVRTISDRLLTMPRADRAAIASMHPGRVDVIAAGALILRRLVDRAGVDDVLVSEHDILDGIAWSLVAG
ncbi:exopolyphosphatase/guanosine-5'-triphosphate,3'-diphosphate pyrophosphatase [Haloactinopolyspora alba]|uniref:Exopolyphosphatase/guanosine-5'-triphosphate, 3'-diphosphate pyrophosphatase n=1 Tax=Haloactinopolyspora alba TaxID=648780 RepID=A0A2P8E5V7_9ACTN|nr:Ppx/GppA phosphatase family protein [Haloactinopolyspora alba]PSL04807.1 exopolyphosphatase/guanosine-5'-triphosphate,3'-diphosphate pyrophosphatase [Haloactinopolyspora alba]